MKRNCLAVTCAMTLLLAAAGAANAETIFVSNEKDNTVTVIDGDTYEVIDTIKTERRPRGIILSPDYKELYVAAGDGNIIDVVDTKTLKVVRQLESGPDPELMDVDQDGKIIYIANEDDSMVTIMETDSGKVLAEVPVGVEPEGMAVSPDNKYTAATSESTSMAHIIDNKTRKLIANILVDSRPREAKWTKDGKELWVSSEIGGTISVIDPSTWTIVNKIGFEVPGVRPEQLQPVGMDFVRDEELILVPLGPANRVAAIDTKKKEVVEYILVGQRPWHGEPSADGKKYYVANGLTNDMTIIDIDSLKAEKSVPVGRLPWGVAVMPGKPGE